MKKFSTYMIVMLMVLFWIIRILVTLFSELGKDFLGIVPINKVFEIVLLFAFFPCVLLVIKRNFIGPILYAVLHAIYFGGDITNKLNILSNGGTLSLAQNTEMIFSIMGIILPLAALIDLLLDRNRKLNPKDKRTDWFYKNEQFDRQLDDRADKNNYKTL